MSRYRHFTFFMLITEFLLLFFYNGIYIYKNERGSHRLYRVEAERVAMELQEKAPEEIDLTKYDTILAVSPFDSGEVCNSDYVIEEVNGALYRIEYAVNQNYNMILYGNVIMAIMIVLTVIP